MEHSLKMNKEVRILRRNYVEHIRNCNQLNFQNQIFYRNFIKNFKILINYKKSFQRNKFQNGRTFDSIRLKGSNPMWKTRKTIRFRFFLILIESIFFKYFFFNFPNLPNRCNFWDHSKLTPLHNKRKSISIPNKEENCTHLPKFFRSPKILWNQSKANQNGNSSLRLFPF